MKNRISILTILLMTAIFSNSCEKMDAVSDKTTNRRIIPTVTTKDLTKSHGQDTPIETMVFKAGDYDIVQTVYDWDSPTSSTIGTKAILTDGNLAAFKTYQYYSNGGRLRFEDTATKSGSTWSFSTDHKWTTEPTVFWSYAGDAAGPADITTSAEGLTANLTASYVDDFIVAYNVERGRDNDVTHSSGDSEDKLNVTFQHAMSLVEFTAEGLPDEEFKITDITVSSVEGGVDNGLVSTSTLSVPASTPLTFTHTPGTGREQLTYTGGNLKKGDIISFIVIPQTVEKLKIDYTIAFDDGNTPTTITRSAIVPNVEFKPGKRYVLNLGLKVYSATYYFWGNDWSMSSKSSTDQVLEVGVNSFWRPENDASKRVTVDGTNYPYVNDDNSTVYNSYTDKTTTNNGNGNCVQMERYNAGSIFSPDYRLRNSLIRPGQFVGIINKERLPINILGLYDAGGNSKSICGVWEDDTVFKASNQLYVLNSTANLSFHRSEFLGINLGSASIQVFCGSFAGQPKNTKSSGNVIADIGTGKAKSVNDGELRLACGLNAFTEELCFIVNTITVNYFYNDSIE